MNKISSFLKNKNTVTILGVLACLVILYVGYTMRINQKVKLVTVYYAVETIQPKTLITDNMVGKMQVPNGFIRGAYWTDYNKIVGKYSNYNTMIAAGSIFYKDLLVDEQNLPDAVLHDINEGERLVSFPVNMQSTYGNALVPGNLVDAYVKYVNDKGDVVYGEFFDKVKILAVKDASGGNVFESTDSQKTPAYLYFSLPENKYLLFSALNYVKDIYTAYDIEVVLVPNTSDFSTNEVATEVKSSDLYNFILDEIQTIDSQKELYNKLLNEMEQQERERKNQQQNQQ